jgi:hypothetical protein
VSRPAAHSVKDYVDKKIANVHQSIQNKTKNLSTQAELGKIQRDLHDFMDYARHQYQEAMEKHQSTLEQLQQEIITLKKLAVKSNESNKVETPPIILQNASSVPSCPPISLSTPIPSSTSAPITSTPNVTLHNSNPFLPISPIPSITAINANQTLADQINANQAYQPLMTTIQNPPSSQSIQPQNTVIYQSVGNIPVPKFRPHLETPENFLKEIELYMKRKRVMPEDWILMLPSIFNQDFNQQLWWQSTKLVVHTWEQFKSEFLKMYGSNMDKHQTLERLLNRRQRQKEHFNKFAFEMNMTYRKIFNLTTTSDELPILQFIAERALPHLKTPLLSCRATTLTELINFGRMFESVHSHSPASPSQESTLNVNVIVDDDEDAPAPPPRRHQQRGFNNNKQQGNNNQQQSKNNNQQQSRNNNKSGNHNQQQNKPRCKNCPTFNNHDYNQCWKNKKEDKTTASQPDTKQNEQQNSGNSQNK